MTTMHKKGWVLLSLMLFLFSFSVSALDIYEDFSNCTPFMCTGNQTGMHGDMYYGPRAGTPKGNCTIHCKYDWGVYYLDNDAIYCTNITIKNGHLVQNITNNCYSGYQYPSMFTELYLNLSQFYSNTITHSFYINRLTEIQYYRRSGLSGCPYDLGACSQYSTFGHTIFDGIGTPFTISDAQGYGNVYCTWDKSGGGFKQGKYAKYDANFSKINASSCGTIGGYNGAPQLNYSVPFNTISLSWGDFYQNVTDFELDNINITGILDYSAFNELPTFNYTLDTSQCINQTDSGMKYYFNYTCYDPEGDTCYYALVQSSSLAQMYKQTFEDSVTYLETAPTGNSGFFNSFFDWIVNNVLTFKIPVGSEQTHNIYDNKTIISDCEMEDNTFNWNAQVYSVNNPYMPGYALYSYHCRSPIIFPLPNAQAYAQQYALSWQYIIVNESQYNYTQTIFRVQDSARNDMFNLSIIKDWISNNVSLQIFNQQRIYNHTLESNYFQVILMTNKTDMHYKFSVRYYNLTTKEFIVFYNSTEYTLGGDGVPKYFMSYPVDYEIPNAYYLDSIFMYSTLTFGSWSPTLNNYFTLNNTAGEFNIYVSDSMHYLNNSYREYRIRFNMPYCSDTGSGGVLPDGTKPSGDMAGALTAIKGVGKGFCTSFNAISAVGNALPGHDSNMSLDFCAIGTWLTWLICIILGVIVGTAIGMFIGRFDYVFSFAGIAQMFFVWIGTFIADFYTWQIILSGFFFAFGVLAFVLSTFTFSNAGGEQAKGNQGNGGANHG